MKPCIPRPFAIAIDDMGWMDGTNDSANGQGPFRLGMDRNINLSDYTAVISLAKTVGVRLQGLFILGELDRDGIANSIPTIKPPSTSWDFPKSELQLRVMDFVKQNAAYLEFGLHGVGHEYWPDDTDKFKRAEWYNLIDKAPWPEESIRAHLDCFSTIMAQYDLTQENHQSFPESFVPCAYSYYWNPNPANGQYSLGQILSEYGVKYANTDFSQIQEQQPPLDGGFDQGIHVLNRYNYGNLWYKTGELPTTPLAEQTTDFIEVHWPNLLAQDHLTQPEVTKQWVQYYEKANSLVDRYSSKNTAEHHSQFLYAQYAILIQGEGKFIIDNTKMPTTAHIKQFAQNPVIKIALPKGKHLSNILCNGKQIPAYFENQGYAILYLPQLESKEYEISYIVDKKLPEDLVWHNSTCNIYSVEKSEGSINIVGRFYGQHKINFLTNHKIIRATTNSNLLKIHSFSEYQKGIELNLTAKNIQGVTARITIHF